MQDLCREIENSKRAQQCENITDFWSMQSIALFESVAHIEPLD